MSSSYRESEMRLDRLVAPGVSMLAVMALITGGRTYEGWSVTLPACSLRALTGLPCIACGGTRAMKALAHGEIVKASQFNPLVVLGVFVVLCWFVWTVATMKMARYQWEGRDDVTNRSRWKLGKRWAIAVGLLVLLNWIYLVFCLPP